MKRRSAPLWGWAVVLSMGLLILCGQVSAQVFPDQAHSWQDLASSLQTPEAIARYMWRHFVFESDQRHFAEEDRWQSPEELLASQRGDCEDFALFTYELLKRNGIPSLLVSLYGRGYGHTICVFKENDRYHAVDGVQVTRAGAKTLKGLLTDIYPFWQKAAVVTLSAATRQAQILQQFQRES